MIALQHQIVHSWASAQRSICQITGEAPVASHTHWMPRSGQQPPRQLNQLCFSFCANCLYHALHLGVARCSLYVLTLGDSVQGFATARVGLGGGSAWKMSSASLRISLNKSLT